ncbi:MAG TPA: class I SAM-dependent methyltransferase [Steroidobacteraceae bacterium]|nr:class I SAM-dependent methyltransferase [Steroidobacteraceae bacterium]
MSRITPPARLVEMASAYYRGAGMFAWRFAQGKLSGDPMFTAILARDLLAGRARILDLGCGQGLLAAWLLAARALYTSARDWPRGWPPPPRFESYSGIEINLSEVARARHAFALDPGAAVQVVHADIRVADYPSADAVVIMDVLHYLDYTAQERVLQRVRQALAPQGLLLLRIGDAAGGAGFVLSKAVDSAIALVRRRRWVPLKCRALREWQALLAGCGFSAWHALPMSAGTPFVNVLLRAEVA